MASQFHQIHAFATMCREITQGKRGFVSIARFSKETGIERPRLIRIAEAFKLQMHNHGKYGLCASRSA